MLDVLRRLVALLFRRRRGPDPFAGVREPFSGRRWPYGPDSAVREPRRRRPGGRGSAVAVLEPDPPESIRAIGSVRR